MIFEINLLKDRAKLTKKRGLLRIILYTELFLFLLTHLILFSYYLTLDYKIKDTEGSLNVLNEDIIFLSREGSTVSSLREINKKHSEITSKLSTINELIGDRILLSHKLKGISQVLPENIWIDKFYITEEKIQKKGKKDSEKAKVIYLNGFVIADKEEAFGRVQSLMRDLEKEPLFKKGIDSIELSSLSRPSTESSGGIMEFRIACWIIKK